MTRPKQLIAQRNVSMSEVCGILLAAGQSRRFGQNKLLHPLSDGTPLISQAIHHMRPVVDRLIVVVPPQQPTLAAILENEEVELIVNPQASDGMGSSLACGVAASPEAAGWIIGLADMPGIQPTTIRQIVNALHQGRKLVAPRYQDRRGHPVGFHHCFAETLLKLHGDTGARAVLHQHATELHLIDVDDPGILLDVDIPADITALSSDQQP